MKYYFISFVLTFLLYGCATKQATNNSTNIKVFKIWDQAAHSAFTDLIRFDKAFYCTFREGPNHVSGPNGTARVIKSTDGVHWESIASFKLENLDIRDPKISVTPDNRIMILMDVESYKKGEVETRKPYVSFSDATGDNFSEPIPSTVDPDNAVKSDWVWRVTWHNGTGYAIDYQPEGIYLLKTKDGTAFQNVSKIKVDGSPNESTIRFDKNGKLYVLIRREQGDRMGMLATAQTPYTKWNFHKLDQRLGGPNFIFLNDSTLCIGSRLYPQQGKTHDDSTAIFLSDLNGNIFKIIALPSGGDTGYPGMLMFQDKLWFTYYSSHEGKTSIYLAKVPLNILKKDD